MIEGFTDLQVIGKGGFSVVYSAREAYVDRLVAIKVLHGVSTDDAMARDRFLREVRAMGRLSGIANVVDVYRPVFTERGEPCIVMPYLASGNLSQQLARSGPQRAAAVRQLGITLATALATAHSRGIHHRDIKPENILLDADDTPYLGDFGIAVMADLRAGSATAATLSPPHAPPERIAPPPVGTADDAAGDVYSLGSTLYTLLAGTPPFGDPSTIGSHEFNLRVLNEPVPPINRADVPAELETLIRQCLDKDQDQRPSAQQVVHTLTALQVPDISPQPTTATTQPDTNATPPRDRPASPDAADDQSTAGATVFRGSATPTPAYIERTQASTSTAGKWLGLGAGAIALFVVLFIGSRALGSSNDTTTTTTTASETTTSTAPPQDFDPVTLEMPLALPGNEGFSVRWTDPNDPAAPIRYYVVEVDGSRVSLPSESEDLVGVEFIVSDLDFEDGSEKVDLFTSEYCMTLLVGATPGSMVSSNTECIGPTT